LAAKKRINVYLPQEVIEWADRKARRLSVELDQDFNRSNVIEMALNLMRQAEEQEEK
jgi:hypothetical protein